MIPVAIGTAIISSNEQGIASQISASVAGGSGILSVVTFVQSFFNRRNRNNEIIKSEVYPTISLLITNLEFSKKYTKKLLTV